MIKKIIASLSSLCVRVAVVLLTVCTSGMAQIANPIPEEIEQADFTLILKDLVQLPSTSPTAPRARINMLREPDDGSGRLFVNDLQGLMYSIEDDSWSLYLNLRGQFPDFINGPGKGTGFGAFAFHPEFSENGLFYTSHAEQSGSGNADFSPVAFDVIDLQWVVFEWTADDPLASTFSGTKRELVRADFPDVLHGFQDITFNPTAEKGDPDYGMLYICIGDGGSSLNFLKENLQTPSSYLGTIFRIDPMGDNSANGRYGIPADNPHAGVGFRNPHRICWDPISDHKMLIGDIGEMNIEEVNIGVIGANYGWSEREGTFFYDRALGRENVYPLPPDDSTYGYTYPVSMYDHDEGNAIVAGYIYRGDMVPELYGKFLFGDIVNGRTFVVDADALEQGKIIAPEELIFTDTAGNAIDLQQLENNGRADLRFGYDLAGNIYVLTKADGFVRTLHSPTVSSVKSIPETINVRIYPNPAKQIIRLGGWDHRVTAEITIYDATGKVVAAIRRYTGSELDVSGLVTGMYTLRVKSGKDTGSAKLVIER
jgi:glucose/arabinose dehydrogenase